MFTLNIYDKAGNYICSITQDTRKACLACSKQRYSEMAWDWDDKNFVKRKRYQGDPSTIVNLSFSNLI
jgi:hypothetical protein